MLDWVDFLVTIVVVSPVKPVQSAIEDAVGYAAAEVVEAVGDGEYFVGEGVFELQHAD